MQRGMRRRMSGRADGSVWAAETRAVETTANPALASLNQITRRECLWPTTWDTRATRFPFPRSEEANEQLQGVKTKSLCKPSKPRCGDRLLCSAFLSRGSQTHTLPSLPRVSDTGRMTAGSAHIDERPPLRLRPWLQ